MDNYVAYIDQLNEEYQEVFSQIETYLSAENIDSVTRGDQLNDLMELFLTAQNAGTPVRNMTGNNLEQFCRCFVSEYGWKQRLQYAAEFFKAPAWFVLVFSVLDLIPAILDGGLGAVFSVENTTNIPGYLLIVALSAVAGMMVGAIIRHFMFRFKRVSMMALKLSVSVISLAVMIPSMLFFLFRESPVPVPAWVTAIASALYLTVYYLFNGRRLKEHKSGQVKFWDTVEEDVLKELPKEMETKYQKANQKSMKKGNGELPMEVFLEKEEQDCKKVLKHKRSYILAAILITAIGTLFTALTDGFERISDLILFVVLTLLVEYLILGFFWRVDRSGAEGRLEWIRQQREKLDQDK